MNETTGAGATCNTDSIFIAAVVVVVAEDDEVNDCGCRCLLLVVLLLLPPPLTLDTLEAISERRLELDNIPLSRGCGLF